MDKLRENRIRGTEDFPFSRYHFENRPAGTVITQIHWHNDMEILYLHRGALEVRVRQTVHRMTAGQILLIHPNTLHSVRVLSSDVCYDALVFSWELVTLPENHFLQKELLLPLQSGEICFPDLLTPETPVYSSAVDHILRICAADTKCDSYKLTVFTGIISFLTALAEGWDICPQPDDARQRRNEMIKQCLSYMNTHYDQPLTLAQIAQQVHLHPNYLCAQFKACTGHTVFDHLSRIRVEEAARLLRTTQKSMAQVATECGFDSSGFFTRKFKAIMGLTPKAYSKRYSFSD